MRTRAPKSDQFWHCEACERRTEHRIGDRDLIEPTEITPSEWCRYGDVLVYERTRVCNECGTPTTTIEIRHDQFRDLTEAANRVDDLETFKVAVQAALSKVT